MELRQMIKTARSETNFDGTTLTRNAMLAADPGVDPKMVDSEGKIVEDFGWGGITIDPDDLGRGEITDHHADYALPKGGEPAPTALGGPTKLYWLTKAWRDMKIEVREKGKQDLLAPAYSWAFSWDNFDGLWVQAKGSPKIRSSAEWKGNGSISGQYQVDGI